MCIVYRWFLQERVRNLIYLSLMILLVCELVLSLDILEIISYCRSDPFTLIDLEFPTNSYMIACTNTQNFEEGENRASTISMEHILGCDMPICIWYDIIWIWYYIIWFNISVSWAFNVACSSSHQFWCKNQVPKVSFKIIIGELMLVFSHKFDNIIFCEYLDILEIISYCRSDPFTLIDL